MQEEQNYPVSTNKFYANLFLGTQGQGIWTHPYSLTWSKGSGNAKSWGIAVSHIEANQRADGPQNTEIHGHPVKYFINPIGIQSIILSATELGPSTVLTSHDLQAFSAQANLHPDAYSSARISFPLIQGMGFVTGIYKDLHPAIHSSVYFRSVVAARSPHVGIYKYRIVLEDDKSWLLYVRSNDGSDPHISLVSNVLLQGRSGWSGIIQVAKNPSGSAGENVYDESSGVYAICANITGSTTGTSGTYQLHWTKGGFFKGNSLPKIVMYALPHHLQSFSEPTMQGTRPVRLQTTTKGLATAIVADSWTMFEPNLPTDVGFAPWTPQHRSATNISTTACQVINAVAQAEVRQDMDAQSNLDSMYFSGKALSKFATLVYAIHDLAQQPHLAAEGLQRLKAAFARFVANQQKYPLVYDTAWKGIVSVGSYVTGDAGQDFGNTYYNDHHFHYGMYINPSLYRYKQLLCLPHSFPWHVKFTCTNMH